VPTEDSTVEATTNAPRESIIISPRTRARRKFERRGRGTPQTSSKAFSIACVTPNPPQRAPNSPIASVSALPRIAFTLCDSCTPMIGNWLSADVSMLARSPGLPASAIPSTVTISSNRGNSDRNP
jgi:hypothetical protein